MWWTQLLSFLTSFALTEAQALAPVAIKSVSDLSHDEAQALATGDAKDTGHILAKVVSNAASEAAVRGISAGAPALLAAVGHALSTIQTPNSTN